MGGGGGGCALIGTHPKMSHSESRLSTALRICHWNNEAILSPLCDRS